MERNKLTKSHSYFNATQHALELAGPNQLFFSEYQAQLLHSLITHHNASNILDYGCGDGTLTFILSQFLPQAQIHGIDTSQELIEIAQGWYGIENDKLTFGTELKQSYDVIYMANVLHHIKKNLHADLLKQLTAHLKPHGIMIVLEFNPFNPLELWRFYRNTEERGNHMIMPRSLKKLVSGYGKAQIHYYKKIYAVILKKN